MRTPTRRLHTTTLTGALMLTTALLLPGAYAQTATPPADTTAPTATTPSDTTPAPPTIMAPPENTPPPAPPSVDTASPVAAPPPAPPPPDENPKKSRFRIGPTIGFFLPSDSKTQDRFGSSWFSIGLGLGPVAGITNKGAIGFDVNLLYQQHNGNHALIVPLGVGYRVALTSDTAAKTVPYAGVTADYYIINFKSNPENINGTYGAGGGSAILGLNFGDTANVEARYQFASKVRGFDFSGLNLTAGYRF